MSQKIEQKEKSWLTGRGWSASPPFLRTVEEGLAAPASYVSRRRSLGARNCPGEALTQLNHARPYLEGVIGTALGLAPMATRKGTGSDGKVLTAVAVFDQQQEGEYYRL